MLGKLGFIITVLIFGGIMFVTGTMAPESVKQTVSNKTSLLLQKLPLNDLLQEAEDFTDQQGKNLAKTEVDNTLTPVHYSLLELPAILPKDGLYAIELDMTLSLASISEWRSSLERLQSPPHEIPIIGPDGEIWTVIATGIYSTPTEAKQHRLDLLQDIPKTDRSSLRIISLPPTNSESSLKK